MLRYVYLLALLFGLSGCVTTYKHVPDGYTGPVVRLTDDGSKLTNGKGEFFYVASINDHPIDNARLATARASQGRGFNVFMQYVSRLVKVEPMKLKLIGSHVTAAPIHELASRAVGEFFEVEGEVDFEPIAGREYLVVGELTKAQSSVWVVDKETKQPVTKKIFSK